MYPRPDYEGNPWSQWGQGVVLPDGRHLSALGDHFGEDGNSFVFEFDPATRELTRTVDVLSLVDHNPGDWGHGKIHAQMVKGACDLVWLTTYWGTRRNLSYSEGYRGDFLFAIDPEQGTIHDLGVLAEEHGVPSLAGAPGEGLLYAEAVDPSREAAGSFVVYDTESAEVVFRDDDAHTGYRAIAVDASGRAYYSLGEGRLAVYDPGTGEISRFPGKLPGDTLRAATAPDRDGIIYGVTKEPEVFFALDPAGSVRQLGAARGKTASVALSPDGSRVFHIPSTHGNAWRIDAPLVAVDTDTGEQEVIVELESLAEEHLGLRLGGSYNVSIDPSGETVYVGMNAGALDDDEDAEFGEVLLMIVTLP